MFVFLVFVLVLLILILILGVVFVLGLIVLVLLLVLLVLVLIVFESFHFTTPFSSSGYGSIMACFGTVYSESLHPYIFFTVSRICAV